MSEQTTSSIEAPYAVAGPDAPDASPDTKPDVEGKASESDAADAALADAAAASEGKDAPATDGDGDGVVKDKDSKDTPDAEALDKVSKATREEAVATLKENGLDFGKFEQEYLANGTLSEESYKALETAGIGKSYVDAYIKGNEAILQQFVGEVTDMAGGPDQYKAITEWAQEHMPKDEIEAFNSVMGSGNKPMIKIAVSGLVSRYRESEGVEPALVTGKASSSSRGDGGSFASAEEMINAMSDPRYGKDPAYTREVERKAGNSPFF